MQIKGDDPILKEESQAVLHVDSLGHGLYAFINGQLAGISCNIFPVHCYKIMKFSCEILNSWHILWVWARFLIVYSLQCPTNFYAGSTKGSYSDPSVSLDVPINLVSGENKIDLLSLTVGLQVKIIFALQVFTVTSHIFSNQNSITSELWSILWYEGCRSHWSCAIERLTKSIYDWFILQDMDISGPWTVLLFLMFYSSLRNILHPNSIL